MRLKPIQPLGATSPVAARCGWLGFRKLLSHACLLVLLLAFCLRVALPVRATARTQAAPSLEILNIENREFPLIRVEVKPRNLPIGSAAPIVTNAFTILENGNSVPARDVQENYQGIHLTLVVNPDFALDSRDPKGVSRYSKLVGAFKLLSDAFNSEGKDRFSLYINPDYVFEQLSDFSSLITALDAYSGNFRSLKSDLASLTRAVDALSMEESGKDKIILYVTGLPTVQDAKTLQLLTETAREKKIKVVIWLAGEAFIAGYPQIPYLQDLAESSGGSLFIYSGNEALPETNGYIQNLGKIYAISYLSLARKSGNQTLAVRLQLEEEIISSSSASFEVVVEPAKLSFINLPDTLSLQQSEDGMVTPSELPVQALIDFVDGHPRNITSARLLVNGKSVQENVQAPYSSFILRLAEYAGVEKLTLQIAMEDELGLEASTAPFDILISTVPVGSTSNLDILKSPWLLVALGAALTALAALVVLPALLRPKAKPIPESSPEAILPLPTAPQKILATLTKLSPENIPTPEKPVAITQEISIFGRDPDLCNVVLDDPAIEPMHCQLRMLADGEFRLTDFRSAAGTWVNYAPVGVKGIRLYHGDLIQLGSLTFRFGSGSRIAVPEKNAPGVNKEEINPDLE